MKRRFASPLGVCPSPTSCDTGDFFLTSFDKSTRTRQSDIRKFSSPIVKSAKKSNGNYTASLSYLLTDEQHNCSQTDDESVEIPGTPKVRVRTPLLNKGDNRLQTFRSDKPSPYQLISSNTSASTPANTRIRKLQPAASLTSNQQLKRISSGMRSQSQALLQSRSLSSISELPILRSLRPRRVQSCSQPASGAKEDAVSHLLPAEQIPISQNHSTGSLEKRSVASARNCQTVYQRSKTPLSEPHGGPQSTQSTFGEDQTPSHKGLKLLERKGNDILNRTDSKPDVINISDGESPTSSDVCFNKGREDRTPGVTTGSALQVLECPRVLLQVADVLSSQTGRNFSATLALNICKTMVKKTQERIPTALDLMKAEPISAALQNLKAGLLPSFLPFMPILERIAKPKTAFDIVVKMLPGLDEELLRHRPARGNFQNNESPGQFQLKAVDELSRGNEERAPNVSDGSDLSTKLQDRHSVEQGFSSEISNDSTLEKLPSKEKANDWYPDPSQDDKYKKFRQILPTTASKGGPAPSARKVGNETTVQQSCLYEAQRFEFQTIWSSKHLKKAEVFTACIANQDFLCGILTQCSQRVVQT